MKQVAAFIRLKIIILFSLRHPIDFLRLCVKTAIL